MSNNEHPIDRNTLNQLLTDAENELLGGHLSAALDILPHVVPSVGNTALAAELNEAYGEVRENYRRLLRYMGDGMDDPLRDKVYQRLVEKTHRLTLDVHRGYDIAHTSNAYTLWAHGHENLSLLVLNSPAAGNSETPITEREDLQFNQIWTAHQLTPDEEEGLRLTMLALHSQVVGYLLNALTLAQMHYFDVSKLRLLLDYADNPDNDLRARALFGITVTAHLHHRVIALYKGLDRKIQQKCTASQPAIESLTQIQYHVALYRESEQIQRKLEQEILPTLIKVSQQRIKMGFEDTDLDFSDPDSTPNVSKKTRQRLLQGFQEMARLFREGMDVNLQTFISLKNFPFFKQPGHWLVGFDSARANPVGYEAINSLPLCENDKYSVSLLLQYVSDEQRQQLAQMLENHEGLFANQGGKTMDPFQNVVQTFYRLLKRSPWNTLWPDVFDTMMLSENPITGEVLRRNSHYLHTMSAMLLRNRHYAEAEKHLTWLAQTEGSDGDMLVKTALCQQEQGRYARAIDNYRQAAMLGAEDDSLLYRMQYCLAQAGRYGEQLDCLLKLEKHHPDEAKVLTDVALCLMQLERWEEAQKRFFKLEYSNKRVVPALRGIAWCALRMRDLQLAQRYYDRILTEALSEIHWEDYINAGHTAWCQGNTVRAVELYTEGTRRYLAANPEAKDALLPYDEDANVLLELGKTKTDIAIMHDLVATSYSSPFNG